MGLDCISSLSLPFFLPFKYIGPLVSRKKIFKVLTIYGHGRHVGLSDPGGSM